MEWERVPRYDGERVEEDLLDLARGVLLRVEDRREQVLDDGSVSPVLRELREQLLPAALRLLLLDALDEHLPANGRKLGEQLLGGDRPVPELQRLHLAELGHRLAVGADAGQDRVLRDGVAQAVVPAGHDEARGEALDVPLPRRREGLVEVVDGEDDLPLRGGEAAEVAEVRVAAGLDAEARDGRGREVGGHGERRAPVEREGRLRHAPVAEGKEIGHPPLLGFEDEVDRVGAALRRRPCGVGFARARLPQLLAERVGLVPAHPPCRAAARAGAGLDLVDPSLRFRRHDPLLPEDRSQCVVRPGDRLRSSKSMRSSRLLELHPAPREFAVRIPVASRGPPLAGKR